MAFELRGTFLLIVAAVYPAIAVVLFLGRLFSLVLAALDYHFDAGFFFELGDNRPGPVHFLHLDGLLLQVALPAVTVVFDFD